MLANLIVPCALVFGVFPNLGNLHPQESKKADLPRFIISTVAGTGEPGMTYDEVPATEALIERPTAVALDSKGNLFIADERNAVIRRVDKHGIMTIVAGSGETDHQSEDLDAVLTNLSSAYGIAVDHKDQLYILSRGHSKIFRVGDDGIATRIIGNGSNGFSGDGGPAIAAQINFSNHLVADAKGNLFIADTGNDRIRKVDMDGIISTVAGDGSHGFHGDGGPALKAGLSVPAAIAIDAEGNLYIADFGNHRIRKVDTRGIISTIAGNGKASYNGDGMLATQSQIGEPCGVAVDKQGYVFIGDQINSRVRMVTPAGLMHTVAGTGVLGLSGDGGPAKLAQVSNPDIIALDAEDNLYIPDHINCVVRKLTRQ